MKFLSSVFLISQLLLVPFEGGVFAVRMRGGDKAGELTHQTTEKTMNKGRHNEVVEKTTTIQLNCIGGLDKGGLTEMRGAMARESTFNFMENMTKDNLQLRSAAVNATVQNQQMQTQLMMQNNQMMAAQTQALLLAAQRK